MTTLRLCHDSRDKIHAQHFGQIFDFPKELNFDTPLYDDVQPLGDVKCTCYTTCDIAEDQNNFEFDIIDLWKRIPNTSSQGADPRDVFDEAVKNGLLPKGKTERLKNWKSYWRADLGSMDPFDNVRSALMMVRSPIGAGTFWYREWFQGGILPQGKTVIGGHMYDIEGWKEINGEPYLIIEAWLGQKFYMSRAVFNAALKPYGMQTWVLSTAEDDTRRVKSLTDTIKDLCINLIIMLRNLVVEKKEVPVVPAPSLFDSEPEPILPPINKYDWDTPIFARHSVRMICDEEGLDTEQKNTLCATIGGESGWKIGAKRENLKNGKVWSTDWGICQWNDYYHSKEISPEEAVNNPEKAVRLMCSYWKRGQRNLWIAYKSGAYKKYL